MSTNLDRRHWDRIPTVDGHDRHGLGTLSDARCLQLLGAEPVGRLGFSSGSLPVIHPVNYFLLGRTVVFRSEPGQKVHAAEHGSVACLEVDHFDVFGHEGWSVLATGRLDLAPPERVAQLARLPIAPWAIEEANCFIEMPIEVVSGRAVGASTRLVP